MAKINPRHFPLNNLHIINQPGKAKAKNVKPTRKKKGLGKEALKIPNVPKGDRDA